MEWVVAARRRYDLAPTRVRTFGTHQA